MNNEKEINNREVNYKNGKLDIIIGPMFSGKTTELLRRGLIESNISNSHVLFINHKKDSRTDTPISTHNQLYKNNQFDSMKNIDFIKISDIKTLMTSQYEKYNVICIDEAQFFNNLCETISYLVDIKNKHIIVSGLSGDYNRNLIGEIYKLLPICDSIKKLHSYCLNCSNNLHKNLAHFNCIKKETKEIINIGDDNIYEVLCRKCYLLKNE